MSLEDDLRSASTRLGYAVAYAEKNGYLQNNSKERILNDLTDIVAVLIKMQGVEPHWLAGWSSLLSRVDKLTMRGAPGPRIPRHDRHSSRYRGW